MLLKKVTKQFQDGTEIITPRIVEVTTYYFVGIAYRKDTKIDVRNRIVKNTKGVVKPKKKIGIAVMSKENEFLINIIRYRSHEEALLCIKKQQLRRLFINQSPIWLDVESIHSSVLSHSCAVCSQSL